MDKKDKLRKIMRKFHMKVMGAVFLYFMWLLFCTFTIVLINEMYVHSEQFTFLGNFGSGMITGLGFVGTIKEMRDITNKEVAAVNSEVNDA